MLIALADQAAVTTEDLRRLAGVWRRDPASIAAAQYAGGVGVPAIFPRWCFRELNELRGDRGAQVLLHRHVDRLVRLPMPSAELDIDRPEDLLALEAQRRSSAKACRIASRRLVHQQRQQLRQRKRQHQQRAGRDAQHQGRPEFERRRARQPLGAREARRRGLARALAQHHCALTPARSAERNAITKVLNGRRPTRWSSSRRASCGGVPA